MKKNILSILLLMLVVVFASCTKTSDEKADIVPVEEEKTTTEAEELAIHLTDANFYETIENTEGIALVDFWAEWCGPCLELGPILEEVAEEENITLYKLNVDENQAIPVEFNVNAIPMVLVYKDGELVGSQIGLGTKKLYIDMIEKYRD